jgi:hypothetical protein
MYPSCLPKNNQLTADVSEILSQLGLSVLLVENSPYKTPSLSLKSCAEPELLQISAIRVDDEPCVGMYDVA